MSENFHKILKTMDPELPSDPKDLTLSQAKAYVMRHFPGNVSHTISLDTLQPPWRSRSGGSSAPVIEALPKVRNLEQDANKKVFFYKNWVPAAPGSPPVVPHPRGIDNPVMVNVDNLDAVDFSVYSQNDTVMFFGPDEEFICARLSARSSAELRGRKGSKFNHLRNLLEVAGQVKPNIPRGAGRGGSHTPYYKCWGWRKAYDNNPIGEYSYKPSARKEEVEYVDTNLKEFINSSELIIRRVLQRLINFHWFQNFALWIGLPSFSSGRRKPKQAGFFTQLSLASGGYWSNLHTDTDYVYTLLSVLASEESRDNEVLYYFNFPEFALSIPLKSGEMIVFDSNVPHCSTNAKNSTDYIWSAYVSAKTVGFAMLEMVQNIMKNKTEDK